MHSETVASASRPDRYLSRALIIDTIPQYIIVLEPDGKLLQVNLQVLDYSGFTADDVQTPEFRTRLLHPDDWEGLADERRKALARGEHLNWNCDLSERMVSIVGFS